MEWPAKDPLPSNQAGRPQVKQAGGNRLGSCAVTTWALLGQRLNQDSAAAGCGWSSKCGGAGLATVPATNGRQSAPQQRRQCVSYNMSGSFARLVLQGSIGAALRRQTAAGCPHKLVCTARVLPQAGAHSSHAASACWLLIMRLSSVHSPTGSRAACFSTMARLQGGQGGGAAGFGYDRELGCQRHAP